MELVKSLNGASAIRLGQQSVRMWLYKYMKVLNKGSFQKYGAEF